MSSSLIVGSVEINWNLLEGVTADIRIHQGHPALAPSPRDMPPEVIHALRDWLARADAA